MNAIEGFNQGVFLIVNANSDAGVWMLSFARFLAHYASYAMPIILLCAWLYGDRLARVRAVKACSVVLLAMAVNLLIAHLWFHPRPFMLGLGTNFMKHAPETSFPSDHMTTASAVAWVYVLARQKVLGPFLHYWRWLSAGRVFIWGCIFHWTLRVLSWWLGVPRAS